MTLDDARKHINSAVIYDPGFNQTKEDGIIVAVSSVVVFVRYVGDFGVKGTYPENLTLLGS